MVEYHCALVHPGPSKQIARVDNRDLADWAGMYKEKNPKNYKS